MKKLHLKKKQLMTSSPQRTVLKIRKRRNCPKNLPALKKRSRRKSLRNRNLLKVRQPN
jgi:hypothetical protein